MWRLLLGRAIRSAVIALGLLVIFAWLDGGPVARERAGVGQTAAGNSRSRLAGFRHSVSFCTQCNDRDVPGFPRVSHLTTLKRGVCRASGIVAPNSAQLFFHFGFAAGVLVPRASYVRCKARADRACKIHDRCDLLRHSAFRSRWSLPSANSLPTPTAPTSPAFLLLQRLPRLRALCPRRSSARRVL